MVQVLNAEFLAGFDARLRAMGAPIVDAWTPGLSDDEIDAVLSPLDIDLPEEARVWWRWHNGTRDDAPMTHRTIGPRGPLTLQDSASLYDYEREDLKHLFDLEAVLTPVNERPMIYFGCAGARDDPVPIYIQQDIETPAIQLPSIRSLVLTWYELIDAGAWCLNPDGLWHFDYERVPADLARLGVF